jgi:predicted phosphodiesterase
MKFAIMADIHANLEAFQAALKDSELQGCTHYAFLGDFVGYCADPKACLDIVRKMNAPCVKGNHDEYCSTNEPLTGFNPRSATVVQWTRNQLTDDDRKWLRDLPYVCSLEHFTLVHATLDDPQGWGYVFDKFAASSHFARQESQICFFGHTHVPVAFIQDSVVLGGTYTKFKKERAKRYFINGGAVGQPRDNNPKASYVIYDIGLGAIELRRVDYDKTKTQQKIKDAGFPLR